MSVWGLVQVWPGCNNYISHSAFLPHRFQTMATLFLLVFLSSYLLCALIGIGPHLMLLPFLLCLLLLPPLSLSLTKKMPYFCIEELPRYSLSVIAAIDLYDVIGRNLHIYGREPASNSRSFSGQSRREPSLCLLFPRGIAMGMHCECNDAMLFD